MFSFGVVLCRITAATSGDLHSTPSIFNGDAHDDDDDDDYEDDDDEIWWWCL